LLIIVNFSYRCENNIVKDFYWIITVASTVKYQHNAKINADYFGAMATIEEGERFSFKKKRKRTSP